MGNQAAAGAYQLSLQVAAGRKTGEAAASGVFASRRANWPDRATAQLETSPPPAEGGILEPLLPLPPAQWSAVLMAAGGRFGTQGTTLGVWFPGYMNS